MRPVAGQTMNKVSCNHLYGNLIARQRQDLNANQKLQRGHQTCFRLVSYFQVQREFLPLENLGDSICHFSKIRAIHQRELRKDRFELHTKGHRK